MATVPQSLTPAQARAALAAVTQFAATVMDEPQPPVTYRTPVVRFATFQPCLDAPEVYYGTATLNPRCAGYTWQQDNCDWTLQIHRNDPRLRRYGRIEA